MATQRRSFDQEALLAFISLSWGRPPAITTWGDDGTGSGEMTVIKREPTGEPLDAEWRSLSLVIPQWDALFEIGRAFGWQPAGTVACAESRPEHIDREGGYGPDWRLRQVTGPDAEAWAAALERAEQIIYPSDGGIVPVLAVPLAASGASIRQLRSRGRRRGVSSLSSFDRAVRLLGVERLKIFLDRHE